MITTVTGKNQISIPAKIARTLDIQPGSRIDWNIDTEGELTVRLLPRRGQLARKIAGVGKEWLPINHDPIAELIKERIQDDVQQNVNQSSVGNENQV